jgi:cobalamin biosynthesis protein CobT
LNACSGQTKFKPIEFDPGLVSGETARLRSVLALNRKRRMSGSLSSGPKLDVPHLHRIGQDDFRIFGRNDRPDKRDWFVLVGLDDSGSTTTNGAGRVIREMGLGIGEMLTGVGIKFAMYGHSGRWHNGYGSGFAVTHKVIKSPDEPWTSETKERLQSLCREDTGNLDGHSLEQYRKVIEARRETDKMILYVTDGAMPMMNFNEELEVLQREIGILKRQRVNLFGVGYRTDSPKEHGMDTVVIQDGQDLPGLIHGLSTRLGV